MRIDQYRLPLGRYHGERRAYLPGRPAAMSRHSTSRASAGGAGTLDLFDKPAGPLNECAPRQRAGKSGADLSDWQRHRVLAQGRPQQSTRMLRATGDAGNSLTASAARWREQRRRRRARAIRSCIAAPCGPNGRLP
jgi:hypothetical protein